MIGQMKDWEFREPTENVLSEEETRLLKKCAANHQVTLNTMFQAAWALLLGRHCWVWPDP